MADGLTVDANSKEFCNTSSLVRTLGKSYKSRRYPDNYYRRYPKIIKNQENLLNFPLKFPPKIPKKSRKF